MGLPKFFPSFKHRVFEYKPIYYNPQKEELEERIRKAEEELGVAGEKKHFRPSITRGSMRGYIKEAKKAGQRSNLRLLIILFLLIALAIYLFVI